MRGGVYRPGRRTRYLAQDNRGLRPTQLPEEHAMNMVEKILARTSGRREVVPGDVVVADVDTLILHDLSGYLTGRVLENEVKKPIRYPERILMVFDHHFSPASEERA